MTPPNDPVAIITGAGRGIGRAFALRFARDGYRVVVADLNLKSAQSVCAEIAAAGGTAHAMRTDVSAEADARACVATTVERWKRVDVLINNAAHFADIERRPFWEVEAAEWDRVLAVNARGTWLMMKAAAAPMRERLRGSIINMSSNTFLSGVPGFAHYIASKGAIVGLTRTAARDLGEYNVRVNCILPGLTRTEVVRASDEAGRYEQLVRSQSIKRVETPEDLVGTAAFLASDDSAFMTGAALTVDGGNSFH